MILFEKKAIVKAGQTINDVLTASKNKIETRCPLADQCGLYLSSSILTHEVNIGCTNEDRGPELVQLTFDTVAKNLDQNVDKNLGDFRMGRPRQRFVIPDQLG